MGNWSSFSSWIRRISRIQVASLFVLCIFVHREDAGSDHVHPHHPAAIAHGESSAKSLGDACLHRASHLLNASMDMLVTSLESPKAGSLAPFPPTPLTTAMLMSPMISGLAILQAFAIGSILPVSEAYLRPILPRSEALGSPCDEEHGCSASSKDAPHEVHQTRYILLPEFDAPGLTLLSELDETAVLLLATTHHLRGRAQSNLRLRTVGTLWKFSL